MATGDSGKPISAAQLVGILAFSLALFFVLAYATKTVEAYRLRAWRDRLQGELADMERERTVLQAELERRQSMAWVDKVLRSAGMVPEGVVRVIVRTVTPGAAPISETATPPEGGEPSTAGATTNGVESLATERSRIAQTLGDLFDTPHWKAWQDLIWGFDE